MKSSLIPKLSDFVPFVGAKRYCERQNEIKDFDSRKEQINFGLGYMVISTGLVVYNTGLIMTAGYLIYNGLEKILK
jgi:hypothetical protein